MEPLYDAHLHLQDERLRPLLPQLIQACIKEKIQGGIINGTHPNDWPAVAQITQEHPGYRAAYGLHPWKVANAPEGWQETLRQYLGADPQASVGEIGLDKWIRNYDLPAQREAFRAQWLLAAEWERPATVHCLKAFGTLHEELQGLPRLRHGFLLHAYGGPAELLPAFIEAGALFSFNLHFMQPRKGAVRQLFTQLPLERLLIETDAPAMPPPEEFRDHALPGPTGREANHPANLRRTLGELAKLRQMSEDALAAQLRQNYLQWLGGK